MFFCFFAPLGGSERVRQGGGSGVSTRPASSTLTGRGWAGGGTQSTSGMADSSSQSGHNTEQFDLGDPLKGASLSDPLLVSVQAQKSPAYPGSL